ncbi:MAG: hypothetical protein ACRC39_01640 [Enterobacter sp.]
MERYFLTGDFLTGDFLAGDFLVGDFLAGDFLAGDFLAGDFFLAGDLERDLLEGELERDLLEGELDLERDFFGGIFNIQELFFNNCMPFQRRLKSCTNVHHTQLLILTILRDLRPSLLSYFLCQHLEFYQYTSQ